MKTQSNIKTIASAGLLATALVLTGCGGGSSHSNNGGQSPDGQHQNGSSNTGNTGTGQQGNGNQGNSGNQGNGNSGQSGNNGNGGTGSASIPDTPPNNPDCLVEKSRTTCPAHHAVPSMPSLTFDHFQNGTISDVNDVYAVAIETVAAIKATASHNTIFLLYPDAEATPLITQANPGKSLPKHHFKSVNSANIWSKESVVSDKIAYKKYTQTRRKVAIENGLFYKDPSVTTSLKTGSYNKVTGSSPNIPNGYNMIAYGNQSEIINSGYAKTRYTEIDSNNAAKGKTIESWSKTQKNITSGHVSFISPVGEQVTKVDYSNSVYRKITPKNGKSQTCNSKSDYTFVSSIPNHTLAVSGATASSNQFQCNSGLLNGLGSVQSNNMDMQLVGTQNASGDDVTKATAFNAMLGGGLSNGLFHVKIVTPFEWNGSLYLAGFPKIGKIAILDDQDNTVATVQYQNSGISSEKGQDGEYHLKQNITLTATYNGSTTSRNWSQLKQDFGLGQGN